VRKPRTLQLIAGLALVALGAVLVMAPTTVAETLGKPHDKPTQMINLRASYGGTLTGIGAFIAWLPAWSPKWRVVAGLLMWAMAGIAVARLVGFAVDGSPDTRQYIWIVAEVVIVIGCAFALRRRVS
jgi:hypothetical protein